MLVSGGDEGDLLLHWAGKIKLPWPPSLGRRLCAGGKQLQGSTEGALGRGCCRLEHP